MGKQAIGFAMMISFIVAVFTALFILLPWKSALAVFGITVLVSVWLRIAEVLMGD